MNIDLVTKPLAAVLVILALSACSSGQAPTPGQLDLPALRGQWVVVNYWAIWCKPCIQEIPELNELDHLPQVAVFGVNYDGTAGEQLRQQVETLDVQFPTLAVDPAETLGVERPMVLPTTFIINPQGQLQDTLIGPQTLQTLANATEQVLGAKPDG
ncbi:MAG: TlpA disulfide reductase family protein [Pseudomonadota bacterium]